MFYITLIFNALFLAGIITAEYLNNVQKIEIQWCNETVVENAESKISCGSSNDVCRALARLAAQPDLFGSNIQEKTEVDHWLTYSIGPLTNKQEFNSSMNYLNKVLGPITYLVAKRITIADFCVFASLYGNYLLFYYYYFYLPGIIIIPITPDV